MTIKGLLAGFSFAACLLLLTGIASAAAATSYTVPPLQPGPFSCTLSASPVGTFSANFSGTVSGGVVPYYWTLYFGDGNSTSGSLGGSGDSYFASHTYMANGTYTATFKAHDSKVSTFPDTCTVLAQVTIRGPITVNATLADSIMVTDNAVHTSAQSLTERISLTDTALTPATVVLRESLGLLDAVALSAQSLLTEVISLAETGHFSSTSAVETQTTSGSGGLQFPLQYVAIPAIGLVLALSYLLIRRYRLLGF